MINLDKIKERDDLVLEELEGGLFGGLIRIVKIDADDLLFNAKDCALILEYKDTKQAIRKYVDASMKTKLMNKNLGVVDSTTPKLNKGGALFITEEGLYHLIAASKMPKAEEFRKWVFGEVLPTFRKTGRYTTEDFTKSKYRKTIKQIPGYTEDENFKHECTVAVNALAKSRGELTGNIWNKVNNILFDHFNINILREITKFTKKNKLTKRPNTREYLDIAGYQRETYMAFEILRHDDSIKVNPEKLAYVIGMCQNYYARLNETERKEIRAILMKLFEDGILKPAKDYEIIKDYDESMNGNMKYITFND